MTNVMQPSIDFHPRPVSHSPSPLSFGFGLSPSPSMVSSWTSLGTSPHTFSNSPFTHVGPQSHHIATSRSHKRRYEPEEDTPMGRLAGSREDAIDRSPTPERSKRAVLKRARITSSEVSTSKEGKDEKRDNACNSADDNDVDVGVLLASLPSQSLLPILTALIKNQPSLKSLVLPLIPRPTLDTAIQALAASARKLRDAYPYSNSTSLSHSHHPQAGFCSSSRVGLFGTGFDRPISSNSHNSGMRESYILSRLTPHITEFVAACMSYLPYFSYLPQQGSASYSHSTILQSLHKDKTHPSETFKFLSALSEHLLSQPTLTQISLAPLLIPRLLDEWNAWIDRVDDIVNRQGGMFGSDTVREWETKLDEFASTKLPNGVQSLRDVRDRWVAKVGWLIGRTVHHPMDEL